MRKEIIFKILFFGLTSGVICLLACHQPNIKVKVTVKHLAEIHRNGAVLYVDPADSRQVIRADKPEAFIAYKIRFEDSVTNDKKHELGRNEYYDFRMAHDWKAVIGNDSIHPAFFRSVAGLNNISKEGILVFELPAGQHPDALIYDDFFGDWQKQVIALNPHLK